MPRLDTLAMSGFFSLGISYVIRWVCYFKVQFGERCTGWVGG